MALTSIETCAKKRTYLTSDEALKALRNVYSTTPNQGTLAAYRCNCCRKFHLGNNRALVAA